MSPYVYFTRHGETNAVRDKYLQSQTIDEPLNTNGIRQAKNLGNRLRFKNIGLIITSTSKRTMETANFVMDAISPPYVSHNDNPDFLEINCGSLDGLKYKKIKQKFPKLYDAWWGTCNFTKHAYPFPNGENFDEIVNRGKRAVNYLKEVMVNSLGNTLIVGHGSMNTVIIAQILGLNPETLFSTLYFENCGLVKIDTNHRGNGRARLIID